MSVLFLVLCSLILCSLNQTTSIGSGSWFEGKRSLLPQNQSLFSRNMSLEFKRIRTVQNKLNYLRKLCKTILKNSQENEGIAIVKACKKNLPL